MLEGEGRPGSPNLEPLASFVLGLLFLLLLVICVLLLGSFGLGVVIVFDICDGLPLLGDAVHGSFVWCCFSLLPLVVLFFFLLLCGVAFSLSFCGWCCIGSPTFQSFYHFCIFPIFQSLYIFSILFFFFYVLSFSFF